jgi:hypothetical protein
MAFPKQLQLFEAAPVNSSSEARAVKLRSDIETDFFLHPA